MWKTKAMGRHRPLLKLLVGLWVWNISLGIFVLNYFKLSAFTLLEMFQWNVEKYIFFHNRNIHNWPWCLWSLVIRKTYSIVYTLHCRFLTLYHRNCPGMFYPYGYIKYILLNVSENLYCIWNTSRTRNIFDGGRWVWYRCHRYSSKFLINDICFYI